MNEHATSLPVGTAVTDAPSVREQEVLSAVLDLMVEEGDGFSMASVARKASCSKETLYRWYGDRDGLLTATVKWQASKVIMPELGEGKVTLAVYSRTLLDFAESWLTVLTGDVSIALNRLAVAHAGNGKTNLGNIVLENGPLAMKERLLPIFELGNKEQFIGVEGDDAFRLFFGLVVADAQIRALLGDSDRPTEKEIKEFAQRAVKRFLILCGNSSNKETL
ncbi:MAG: TetR/AcrR family transcriptional regulator C-terminal domain-containing protein [Pseudomonadota bacterium]